MTSPSNISGKKFGNKKSNCKISCAVMDGTVTLSHRALLLIAVSIVYLLCLQCFTIYTTFGGSRQSFSNERNNHPLITITNFQSTSSRNSINNLRYHSNNKSREDFVCRWYVAESAMPHSGLGVYTGIGLHKDEDIGYPDVCIYVKDGNFDGTHLSSHTWGASNYFGAIGGRRNRAACEGLVTIANTAHPSLINIDLISQELQTNAGLHRAYSPGSGAITQNYGIHGRARDVITAGSELIVDYFDWDFSHIKEPVTPKRDIPWLQKHGWCIDKIDIGLSTIPHAGRGAFARTNIQIGEVVAPAPLQVFKDRKKLFQTTYPEQLLTNYCLQPNGSKMMFFPYGQAVNLINHSSKQPNVEWRWSTKSLHHAHWLDLPLDEFWKLVKPGNLILEVVAIRDIKPGEEILINYGDAWESAWNAYVGTWKPPPKADMYVYPADMDETAPLRTVDEQITNPYPYNIATVCVTPDYDRKDHNHVVWTEPKDASWWDTMTLCHILSRETDKHTGYVTYNVSLVYSSDPDDYKYDPTSEINDLYIDTKVPRRAIRFIDVPYLDDEHIATVFRHPMEFPKNLVPSNWLD